MFCAKALGIVVGVFPVFGKVVEEQANLLQLDGVQQHLKSGMAATVATEFMDKLKKLKVEQEALPDDVQRALSSLGASRICFDFDGDGRATATTATTTTTTAPNRCSMMAAGGRHILYMDASQDPPKLNCLAVATTGDAGAGGACHHIPNLGLDEVRMIASGSQVNFVLKTDNTLIHSGRGNWITKFIEHSGSDKQRIIDVLAGSVFSCLRFEDKSVKCESDQTWIPDKAHMLEIDTTFTGLDMKFWAAGRAHACAILMDDTVLCSPNADTVSGTSTPPSTLGKVDQLCLGAHHHCAIRSSDKRVICWGQGDYDQLTEPDRIGAVSLSCTTHFTCAKYDDDTYECWGPSESMLRSWGSDYTALAPASKIPEEVRTDPSSRILDLDVEPLFFCAVLGSGKITCWPKISVGNSEYLPGLPDDLSVAESVSQCGTI